MNHGRASAPEEQNAPVGKAHCVAGLVTAAPYSKRTGARDWRSTLAADEYELANADALYARLTAEL